MKKAKIGGSAMGLTHDQDPLNQYAKRGKPHPRVVLEAVLELMDMQDQVQTADDLLKPTQDNAVRGAQAVAMHLFGDKQVLGLTPAVIARKWSPRVVKRSCAPSPSGS